MLFELRNRISSPRYHSDGLETFKVEHIDVPLTECIEGSQRRCSLSRGHPRLWGNPASNEIPALRSSGLGNIYVPDIIEFVIGLGYRPKNVNIIAKNASDSAFSI